MVKVSLVTTNRSDFGILKNLCKKLEKNNYVDFSLVITGSHLDKKFGYSFNEISKLNFKKKIKIKIKNKSENERQLLKYMSECIVKFSNHFKKNHPDFLILLGDRFETFAVAQTAYVLNIPIIHLHGGEVTYNVLDEGFRHSITKLSMYHFVCTEKYKNRVIQLGENPNRVFNYGSLGVENIKNLRFLNRNKIENKLKIKFLKKNILITFHIETKRQKESINEFKKLLNIFSYLKNTLLIFTYPNNDPGSKELIKILLESKKKLKNIKIFKNLGSELYLNVLNIVDCVAGNSSSGIIEAPSLKKYTLNIGKRQIGRERGVSVINSKVTKKDILFNLNNILTDFRNIKKIKNINPYEKLNTSDKIINKIICLKKNKIKQFYDL